jgi:2'-5' RNA ligase
MNGADDTTLRLFFGVVPDATTREHFAAAADSMPLAAGAKRVPQANFHLTLAFVGDVPASQLPTLRALGSAHGAAAFALRFDAFEYWPKPEVVVVAAREVPAGLRQLWQQLHRELAVHQWAMDAKRLRPHVTLARKVSQPPVLQAMSPFEWRVENFSLIRSDTSGTHSAYTVVDTWPLLDER